MTQDKALKALGAVQNTRDNLWRYLMNEEDEKVIKTALAVLEEEIDATHWKPLESKAEKLVQEFIEGNYRD